MRLLPVFYFSKVAWFALIVVAVLLVASFFDAPLPAGFAWPTKEVGFFALFGGVIAVFVGATALDRRRAVCPECGGAGQFAIEQHEVAVTCRTCGVVGGHLLKNWTVKVLPPGNPTRAWRRDDALPCVADFNEATLCGVRIGGPATRLHGFGPVEDAPKLRDGDYLYYSQGLEYRLENGRLDSFAVYGAESDDPDFAQFTGHIVCRGESISPTDITLSRTVELFGEPKRTEKCDGQICLYYERDAMAIDLEFSAKGNFGMLVMRLQDELAGDSPATAN